MIENIRKYTGLMVLVFVLLFVGLIFMDYSGSRGYGSGPAVVQAHGRGYTDMEYRRRGESPARALQQFASPQNFELIEFLEELGTPPNGSLYQMGVDYRRFLINRINLQEGAREFGVHVSDEEIDAYIRERLFVNQQGSFNINAYDRFEKDVLASLGMGSKDFYRILGDLLAFGKLKEVISAGIAPNREAVRTVVEASQQQIDCKLITLDLATYEAQQDPSDDEVKTYWEANKGSYLSEPRRKISYIVAKPDYSALLEKLESEDAEDPAGEDEAAEETDAEITVDSLSREEKEEVIKELAADLEQIWDDLEAGAGAKFREMLEGEGYEVLTTELVTADELPEEFAGSLFGKDVPTTGRDEVFALHYPGESEMDKISFPIRIGEDWVLFKVEEAEEASELPFEEARDEARVDLIAEKGREALEKAAEEHQKALQEAVAGGKSFDDAASALELEATPYEDVTFTTEFDDIVSPQASQEIFQWVGKVNPGDVSDVLSQNLPAQGISRALIAYVEKRELIDDEQLQNILEQAYRSQEARLQALAFTNWLAQKYAASGVVYPGSSTP